jgi:diguanylate cyclase (GGDEF)-like protein/PAS domain S-box-containing protein
VTTGSGDVAAGTGGERDAPGHVDQATVHQLLTSIGTVGVILHDADGRIVDLNDAALEITGRARAEMLGRVPFVEMALDIVDAEGTSLDALEHPVERSLRTREPTLDRGIALMRPDGTRRWMTASSWPVLDGEHLLGAMVVMVDETERHELVRIQQTVSRAMQVLVHATGEQQLLDEMCRTIVEAGGYPLAWIGRADADESRSIVPLAAAGATGYVDGIRVTWAEDDPTGQGPAGLAIRSGTVQHFDDLQADTGFEAWRRRAGEFDLGSSVCVPFTLPGGIRACLAIYAREAHAFDEGSVALLVDLTRDLEFGLEHQRTSEALAASEEQFRFLAENTGDVVMLSRDGRIEWISPAVRTMLGWEPDDLIGQSFGLIAHPDEERLRTRARADAEARARATYRGRVRRKDGSYAWVDARTRLFHDGDGRPNGVVVSTFWDATSEVRAQEALAHAATHDPLTGLANRSLLVDELQRALAVSRRSKRTTGVLLLDLDHFKYVNDSLGHAVGDTLLSAAADRMVAAVREGDLVARQGGDEFVVVMRELDGPEAALAIGERLLEAFRSPIEVGDAELFTTASIGIAMATEGDQDGLDLLRDADTAMYQAKDDGRDRLAIFNADLRAHATRRLAIANDLRLAVERDELDVWFQPEVSLEDGRLLAIEALLRWHHPTSGTLAAGAFIETAEETGMILDIGRWVLGRSCGQAARWHAERPDHPLVVRVNLSAVQLAEAGLLDDLDDVLEITGLPPHLLCLEITETAMLHETGTVRTNMAGIHRRNIKVAIDDFGTGYASLTYLRRYPIEVVKLDRSFVTNLTTNEQDRQIAAGIIDLARRLGIHVTAEGVEDTEQAAQLVELGCTSAQGYLYAPALTPTSLEALFPDQIGPVAPV